MRNGNIAKRSLPRANTVYEVAEDAAAPFIIRYVYIGWGFLIFGILTVRYLSLGSSKRQNSIPTAAMIDPNAIGKLIR